jgi:hypothetical protein
MADFGPQGFGIRAAVESPAGARRLLSRAEPLIAQKRRQARGPDDQQPPHRFRALRGQGPGQRAAPIAVHEQFDGPALGLDQRRDA